MNTWTKLAGMKPAHLSLVTILKPSFTTHGNHVKTRVCAIPRFGFWNPMQVEDAVHGKGTGIVTSAIESGYRENFEGEDHGIGGEDLIALCKKGQLKQAVDILDQSCVQAEFNTYAFLLKECAAVRSLPEGKRVHAHMTRTGFQSHAFLGNSIVDMYLKCGSVHCARQVFDKMCQRTNVSWNALISAYSQQGHGKEALKRFCEMLREGMNPDLFTFSSVIRACAGVAAIEEGKTVHAHFMKTGLGMNIFVGSALVDMYSKCGCVKDARYVFDKMTSLDVVLWTAIIVGYVQNEHGKEALELFRQMQQTEIKPNQYTFASVLSGCASLAALEHGQQLHSAVIKTGFESRDSVQTSLVSMYAKCGEIESACQIFDKMSELNVVSFTAMITGYAQNGHGNKAVSLFCQMQWAGMKPNQFTFASALRACASLAALEQGKRIHSQILKTGSETNIFVGGALVDMYGKCGSINDARLVFDKTAKRDVVLWNSIIVGYAQNGFAKETFQLFEEMQQAGMKPNQITFIGVLSACSHVGLLDEGRRFFDSMIQDYGIAPTGGHYACMVDLLSRAGCLAEAESLIKDMELKPDAVMWRTLLSACKVHGNSEIGKRAADHVLDLEPENDATYVLLSNIYAADSRWDDVAKVRNMMKDKGVKKEPGISWIEVKSNVYAFVAGDRSHPQSEEIYAKLERLNEQMKEAGYLPDTNFVMQDME